MGRALLALPIFIEMEKRMRQPSKNTLLALLTLFIGGAGVYLWLTQAKPIIFPKDVPAAERETNRRVAFAGAYNFRDLGGYATADGFTVKWGVLYRSDNLAKLTDRDLAALNTLGLYRLIDFRADFEKAAEPNRLPTNPGFQVVELPIFDANSQLGQDIRDRIMNGDVTGIDADQLLVDANTQFASDFTPQFKAFLQEVQAADGKPVLFHCTAGKDRTGFAAAILLRILGVPQETVMQDYMLSKSYALEARARDIFILRLTKGEATARVVEKLSGVEAAYLQAAFATIDAEYGSFENYVRDGLDLDDADIADLRASLLEQ
jgi:protein-tyrosine phosphatase